MVVTGFFAQCSLNFITGAFIIECCKSYFSCAKTYFIGIFLFYILTTKFTEVNLSVFVYRLFIILFTVIS